MHAYTPKILFSSHSQGKFVHLYFIQWQIFEFTCQPIHGLEAEYYKEVNHGENATEDKLENGKERAWQYYILDKQKNRERKENPTNGRKDSTAKTKSDIAPRVKVLVRTTCITLTHISTVDIQTTYHTHRHT